MRARQSASRFYQTLNNTRHILLLISAPKGRKVLLDMDHDTDLRLLVDCQNKSQPGVVLMFLISLLIVSGSFITPDF